MKKFGAWVLKQRGVTRKGMGFWHFVMQQGVVMGIVIPACIIGSFYGVNVLQEAGMIDGFAIFGTAQPESAPRSDYISALIDSGECWSGGEAPAEPTRVIYDGKVYDGDMVGKALDSIFKGADNGVEATKVSGFCK